MTHTDSESMTHSITDHSIWHHYWCHYDAHWLMLTHYLRHHDSFLGSVYQDCLICLFNTNTLYQYINPSLSSLYGRLDFFHNHNIVSRIRPGNVWVVPLRAFIFASHHHRPSTLPCIPNQNMDLQFVSPLLVLSIGLTWHFHSHQSWAQLNLILVHHRTEALIWLRAQNQKPQNTHHTITPVVALH